MGDTATQAGYISFEQFLADPSVPQCSEWVDGTVVPMHAVADRHDAVVGWLRELVGAVTRELDLGRVLGEPFVMKTGPDLPGRSPDLFVVTRDRERLIEPQHLAGPADLVIEVVSPESQYRDRVVKFGEYERGGVREYWLIDPDRREALFYRSQQGTFDAVEPADGLARSVVLPPVALGVDWLWSHPLPKTLPILRAWGIT